MRLRKDDEALKDALLVTFILILCFGMMYVASVHPMVGVVALITVAFARPLINAWKWVKFKIKEWKTLDDSEK